jgi:FixJ family two-component response regulator
MVRPLISIVDDDESVRESLANCLPHLAAKVVFQISIRTLAKRAMDCAQV